MLKQRVLTALVLAPAALAGIFLLSLAYFQWFILAVMIIAAWEWAGLCHIKPQGYRWSYAMLIAAALIFTVSVIAIPALLVLIVACVFWVAALLLVMRYPNGVGLWSSKAARVLIGAVVLIPTWQALVLLKVMAPDGKLLLLLMLLVWGADIGAYFAGRTWGKRKLAPEVSPGKTWAGLAGGVVCSLLIALGLSLYWQLPVPTLISLMFVCILTVLASVLGDLFESMLKRHRGIKDSSQLLPGHGGVLDRIDSLTAASPVFALGTSLIGFGL